MFVHFQNCVISLINFRILSLILLFTPALGLFNSMHHARLAALSVRNVNMILDNSGNGSDASFGEIWDQFKLKDSFDFLSMPLGVVLFILLFIFTFHTITNAILQKLSKAKHEYDGIRPILSLSPIIQGMHTFLAPPLHLDWEESFRLTKGKLPVVLCWKRYLYNINIVQT